MSPAAQQQRLAASQVFQPCRATDDRVVRDFVRFARSLLDPPERSHPRTGIISNRRLTQSIVTS